MCERTGGVLGGFVLVFHRDICHEDNLIRRCKLQHLKTEVTHSVSAAAGPKLSKTRNPIANLASDLAAPGLVWVRVCATWRPDASAREDAGNTMSVFHKAL